MADSFDIAWPAQGRSLPLSESPIGVGRAAGNDVVLSDETVSGRHAQIWVEPSGAWVRDLGSTNGTFVNDERLVGAAKINHGDKIRFGKRETLVLRGSESNQQEPVRIRYLCEPASGLKIMLRSNRTILGSGPDCALRIEGWPAYAGTLLAHSDGELWLGTPNGDFPVTPGEGFELDGRVLVVKSEAASFAPTVDFSEKTYSLHVVLMADEQGEPLAKIQEPTGTEVFFSGNRAALLTVLARRLAQDREAGKLASEEGWCRSQDCITGVWGRAAKTRNHLNVLVHRTRQKFTEAGVDPYCLEKRRGGIRLLAQSVSFG